MTPDRQQTAERSHTRVKDALMTADKRAVLAQEMDLDEGQLTKMIRGELWRLCQLVSLLGLEIHHEKYVQGLRDVLKEEL